jgi:hypothetical protein
MIVLVTGGRDYGDIGTVFDALVSLNAENEIKYLIHGDAKGADTLADSVAKEIGISRIKLPANWTKFNKGAGSIRNKSMIDLFKIDLVLAFPGGTGTAHMKRYATENGIPVIEALDLINP